VRRFHLEALRQRCLVGPVLQLAAGTSKEKNCRGQKRARDLLRFSITSKETNIDGPGSETRGDSARNKRQIGFALSPSFASSRGLALPTKTLNPATPPQFPHPLRPPCGHAARMPPMEFFWGNHFLPLLPHSIRSAVCSRRVGVFFRAFRSKFGCGSRHPRHQSWRFV
jgi:hypothetical protein